MKEESKMGDAQPSEQLFEQFWEQYDKKVDRDKCLILFLKLPDDDVSKLIEHTPKYVDSTPDKKFRKNPETYLRNKSWHNEIISGSSSGTTPTSTAKGKRGLTLDDLKASREKAGFSDNEDNVPSSPEPVSNEHTNNGSELNGKRPFNLENLNESRRKAGFGNDDEDGESFLLEIEKTTKSRVSEAGDENPAAIGKRTFSIAALEASRKNAGFEGDNLPRPNIEININGVANDD